MDRQLDAFDKRLKKLEQRPLSKILYMLLGLFLVTMIFTYVSYLLGSDYFLLPNLMLPEPIANIICLGLFLINLYLLLIFCDIPYQKLHFQILLYIPLYLIDAIIFPNSFFSSIIFTLSFGMILSYHKKENLLKYLILFVFCAIISITYVYISSIVKLGIIPGLYYYSDFGVIAKIYFNLDYYLFLIVIILLKKEVTKDGWKTKHILLPQRFNHTKLSKSDIEAIERHNQLGNIERWLENIIIACIQLFQFFIILSVCAISNVFIEGFVIVVSFIIFGFIIQFRWHTKSITLCTVICSALFYFGARAVPSFQYTQFLPIVIGLLICYVLYRVAVFEEDVNNFEFLIDDLKLIIHDFKQRIRLAETKNNEYEDMITEQRKFKLKDCNYEEFKNIAISKKLSTYEIELLDHKYCKKTTIIAMTFMLHRSESTIKRHLKMAEEKFYAINFSSKEFKRY